MTKQEPSYQQQILFDENSTVNEHNNEQLTARVLVNNQDYQAAQQSYIENEELVEQEQKPRWLTRAIISLILLISMVEASIFFIEGFSSSPIITSLYALLTSGLVIVAGSFLLKEYRGLKQLKTQLQHRNSVSTILAGNRLNKNHSAKTLCQQIEQQLAFDLPEPVKNNWQQQLSGTLSEQELIQLFDLQVLSKVDEKAIADIAKYSSEAMVLIAISPIALMDMIIMLWRNIRMIDKISGLYGLKLGYWSRIKLIKQVFNNMIFVGASEMIIDVGSDALGADLLGKFSGRMAQGFGAAMLTARLGINTIKASRPMPFIEQQPQLSNVRNQLLKQVKNLLTKQSS